MMGLSHDFLQKCLFPGIDNLFTLVWDLLSVSTNINQVVSMGVIQVLPSASHFASQPQTHTKHPVTVFYPYPSFIVIVHVNVIMDMHDWRVSIASWFLIIFICSLIKAHLVPHLFCIIYNHNGLPCSVSKCSPKYLTASVYLD